MPCLRLSRELKGQEEVGAGVSFLRLASPMWSLTGISRPVALALPGNLVERQNPKLHPRPSEPGVAQLSLL